METPPTRRRAPGMSLERRRHMIVRAALPLVAEYGGAVTTSQIARAAGIGEATIFRAFTDKDGLLDACVVEALRPDHVLDQLAEIPLDQPLAARLTEAADALQAHTARIGTVLGALHASGHRRSRDRRTPPPAGAPAGPVPETPAGRTAGPPTDPTAGTPTAGQAAEGTGAGQAAGPGPAGESASPDPRARAHPLDREESMRRTHEALTELFEPERDALRLPPERLATIFLHLLMSSTRRPLGGPQVSNDDLVTVFVHGALN
ncbi:MULTISPECIES: TetR/AcrR family transcriptional regulator [Streptosporangium]|uniref:AcrR family transcriptional regulator n=1 Tax=Streptosporangium brasiliense TaxID=47480 RepID=A0ABT9REI9_9ACTN|nr:TetR/AcrR family transcriptional regulator [Streptosporangium brasiliense]MDP9867124.1 AcrR family transcriptional regulator [Streptosporangium brasiliense]